MTPSASVLAASQSRLDAFRQESRVRAGSLIVSLFGDAILPRGGRIWLGSLIRLLQPLGVSERLVRTSVFRLARDEWLQAETHGRRAEYALTASGRQRFEEASRLIYATHAPRWDGHWRLILVAGEWPAKDKESLRRTLFWQGFGVLGSCFVHPGADLKATFDILAAEGFSSRPGALMPMLAREPAIGPAARDADLVRQAWDLAALAAAYGAFVARYRPLREALETRGALADETAFLLRLLLIHDYRRLLLRDPDLPEELLPAGWPGQEARRLCREIYLGLLPASERHLNQHLRLADGRQTPAARSLGERFSQESR